MGYVHGHAAWGEGVGESLQAIEPPTPWYLILFPGCQISTAEIFRHPHLTRNSLPVRIADFLSGARVNDCTPLVRRLYPEVDRALRWLDCHAQACMTGTGATVFAAFGRREQAQGLLKQLPSGIEGLVARGCNRSPLLERLSRCRKE